MSLEDSAQISPSCFLLVSQDLESRKGNQSRRGWKSAVTWDVCQLVCVCAHAHTCVQGSLGVGVRSAGLLPICLGLKPSCVTLGKSLNLSFLQFPPLKNGDDDDTNFTGWL